jgi:hypothetical protein
MGSRKREMSGRGSGSFVPVAAVYQANGLLPGAL